MSREEMLEQELQLLGAELAQEPSFVDNVMSRVAQTQIVSSRSTLLRGATSSLRQSRIIVAAACITALALFVAWPFGGTSEPGSGNWWLESSSLYAQELVAVLDKARPGGVTVRNRTTFIMADGARSVSSTVSTYFVSHDRYRCDIFDEGQLRETQWYVPDGEGLIQTSIRFDSRDYRIDKHRDASTRVDHIAKLRAIANAVGQADRHLEPAEIDGQKCIGFEISAAKIDGPKEKGICRIWFNTETKLPVRIESENIDLETTPAFAHGIRGLINTLDRFEWGPRLPANTFTPQIPEGFKEAQK